MAGVQHAFCKLVDLPYEAARSKVKQPATTVSGVSSQIGGGEKLRRDLENTGLPLLPTDVSNDLVDVGGIHRVNLRHIAELPMMGFHSNRCRALERCIAVVIGLVDLMDQGRA